MVVPIAWSRDSTSHLVKYDCEDWSVIREGKVVGEPLAELAVSPDENFVATASSNGHVYVFDSYSMGVSWSLFVYYNLVYYDVVLLFLLFICFFIYEILKYVSKVVTTNQSVYCFSLLLQIRFPNWPVLFCRM